jgi:hypothetical protein
LQQLGRDTVEAVVWPLSEAEALVLDRSLRWGESETALEQGWLLADLEQRFGYGVDELARRFDRSVPWVAHRLALVELLPKSVQQQVRSGVILASLAMKVLVPVARTSAEDCRRLVDALATHRYTSREAGQLYAAWRKASPPVRQRILEQPQLFLKTERQREPAPPASALVEVARDLEMAAILQRANRRRWRRAPTTFCRARKCNTTPLRTRSCWPASNAKSRPRRPCCATRACCSFRCIRPSNASTARCS